MKSHLKLLGLRAKDKVTRFEGVITTVSFDLYGCIQVIITPRVDENGKTKESRWFDITRLQILEHTPVMDQPDFNEGYVASGKKGASDKPISEKT